MASLYACALAVTVLTLAHPGSCVVVDDSPIIDNANFTYYCTGKCGAANTNASPLPGTVLMGGGGDVDAAILWMLQRAGGGDVLVLRASGGDAYDAYMFELALRNGVPVSSVSSIVVHHRLASYEDFVVDKVWTASMVWFAGGDQWKYYSFWKGTPLWEAFLHPFYPQRPIGGTSAGCAIMPQVVYSAQFDSATSSEALEDPYYYRITFGTQFIDNHLLLNTITDTHFRERDRMGRLVALMARMIEDVLVPIEPDASAGDALASYANATGCVGARGIGVNEASALMIDENGFVSSSTLREDGGAYFLCLETYPEECAPRDDLMVSAVRTLRLEGNQTNALHLPSWSVLGQHSVEQYVLSASGGGLTSSSGGVY